MPHKTTEKDGEETKEVTASLPTAKEISVAAARAAVLSELGGIFGFKKKNKWLH